jgi:hypothetical protein
MTFQELHSLVEKDVSRRGDENPSFLGNFGHSIGADVTRRAFIDANCDSGLPPLPRTGRTGERGAIWRDATAYALIACRAEPTPQQN